VRSRGCAVRAAALLAAALLVSGCIVLPIPTPEHGRVAGTGEVPLDASFPPGETTREEVLLRLGQPAAVLCGERVLAYHWAVAHGWVLVATGYGYTGVGAVFPIPKSYLVVFRFDDAGRLVRSDREGDLFNVEPDLAPWVPPGCPTPAPQADPKRDDQMAETAFADVDFATGVPAPALAGPPRRVRLDAFEDARSEEDPNRFAAPRFALYTGLWTYRRVADLARAAVAAPWWSAGHALVDGDAPLALTGRVARTHLDLDLRSPLWWRGYEARASVEVVLEVRRAGERAPALVRSFTGRGRARGSSEAASAAAAAAAFADLARVVGSDASLGALLGEPAS
jgi:hypothetical protein